MTSDGVMFLKILRLARLVRLVRLGRLKAFHDLKLMVEGLVSAVRVLFWAVFLLGLFTYVLGAASRVVLGDKRPEFSSLSSSMLTMFGCFTYGCNALDGSPLQTHFYAMFGSKFVVVYYIVYLSMTLGLLNMITALLIEAVLNAGVKRLQQHLDTNGARMEQQISSFILRRFVESSPDYHRIWTEGCDEDALIQKLLAQLDPEDLVVDKVLWDDWVEDPDMIALFEDIEVDVSTKCDLFDALNVDCREGLSFDELVQGLMKLRGPITKLYVVATRLRVTHIMRITLDICRKLGINYDAVTNSTDMFGI